MTEDKRAAIEKTYVDCGAKVRFTDEFNAEYKKERDLLSSSQHNYLRESIYVGGDTITSDFDWSISGFTEKLKLARKEANKAFTEYMVEKDNYVHGSPLCRAKLLQRKQEWLKASKEVRLAKISLRQQQVKAAKFRLWYEATKEYISELENELKNYKE